MSRAAGRPGVETALFLVVAALNATILWWFHDRHWYPSDEGIYAHIAARLLAGEVMNVEVQNFHPGYIDFLNAAALRVFGQDLLSLRYPLVAGAFIQSCLVFRLLADRSLMFAAVGGIAVTALGTVQFLNPTANWYCLFLTTLLVCWMAWLPRDNAARLVGAGFIVGLVVLFRQLTGAWVGLGLLTAVLWERSTDAAGPRALLARGLLALALAILVAYLVISRETQLGGIVLFAAWPMATTCLLLRRVRAPNRDVVIAIRQLCGGAALATLPLATYLVINDSFSAWIDDVVFGALQFAQLPFLGQVSWYAPLPIAALFQAVSSASPAAIANGLYWTILPLLATVNGVLTIRSLRASQTTDLTLPIVTAFYGLVAMMMENAIYMYYTVGMSLCAVLWLNSFAPRPRRIALAAASAGLAVVAIFFHAGHSHLRTTSELLQGRASRVQITAEAWPRSSLRLDPADRNPYRSIVEVILAETNAGDAILSLPSDAQFYFLADRRNPFRFYNSSVGIRRADDLAEVMVMLERQPPKVVTYRPADKYNTWASSEIVAHVRQRYRLLDVIGGVEVYTLNPAASAPIDAPLTAHSDEYR